MSHRNYTTYLLKELDFLKLLVARFHEQDKIAGLELDIALLKAQDVYEQLLRMKLMPDSSAVEKQAASHAKVDATPLVVEEKPVAEPKIPQAKQPEKTKNPEIVPTTPAAPVEKIPEPPIHEVEVFATVQPPVKPKEETAPPEEKSQPAKPAAESPKSGTGILADKISPSDYHPINETLAQKAGTDLSSKLQTAPLSSIASGIGLNDKFLYIRELFKGDNALYSNTVRHLDTADSLGDAMDFIHRHFSWDKENETTQKFLHLVHRRHGQ